MAHSKESTGIEPPPIPAMPPAVRTLIDAANAGDTEAFLAGFTAHLGLVDDWGRRFHGTHAIRGWSDAEFIGRNVALDVVHFYSPREAEVVVIAIVGGDGFNGPCTLSFRIVDNKVTEMRITA
jgi:hypothetical protein